MNELTRRDTLRLALAAGVGAMGAQAAAAQKPDTKPLRALARKLHNLLTLAVPIQRFVPRAQTVNRRYFAAKKNVEKDPGKPKKRDRKKAAAPAASCPPPHRSEANDAWRGFVRDALKTHHWMVKAARTAKGVLKLLPGHGIDPKSPGYAGDWSKHPHRPRILALLTRHGIDGTFVNALDRHLCDAKGKRSGVLGTGTLAGAAAVMEKRAQEFRQYIQDRLLPPCDAKSRQAALKELTPVSGEVTIPCEALAYPLNYMCAAAAIILIVIAIISTIAHIIEEIIESARDDDEARNTVNGRTCDELCNMSNGELVDLINRMLDGATLDDDERAILRILNCLPPDRVRAVVGDVGRGRLLDDFHGDEWDRLMIRLQECGLADFGDWDDDATRRFINEVDCATIASLTLDEIRQLMLNLFAGDTGDEDEQAIITVIDCLDCETRHRLVEMRGMSVDDFDSEVDGAEWDRLERRFRECGLL